jgi:hypothetical protein
MVNGGNLDSICFQVYVLLSQFRDHILIRRIGLYPKYMFINRGNHEAKEMNRTYGFEGEAKTKHGEQSYKVN